MRKFFWAMTAMMMVMTESMWAISGSGTSSSPYKISSASDMATLRTKVADAAKGTMIYAELTADITSLGTWTPIGTSSKPFNGVFNGGGHTISGMSISSYTATYQGLFGYVNNATIKDFTLSGTMTSSTKLTGTDDASGTVVGRATGASAISGVKSNVNLTITTVQQKHLGGIVGTLEGTSSVSQCTYTGTLDAGSSTDCIGGIVGFVISSCSGSIQNCLFTGKLKTTGSGPLMGGILGYNNDESKNFAGVKNCLSMGTFTYSGSNTYVNGIIGRIRNYATTTVSNCYLSTTASKACNTDGPTIPGSNTSVTSDQLSSGYACYAVLGNKKWFQKLGTDAYPTLDSSRGTVYEVVEKYCDGSTYAVVYLNTQTSGRTYHKVSKVSAVAATCTQTGICEHYLCSMCSKTFSDSGATKTCTAQTAALGHNYNSDKSFCSRCNHTFLYYTSTDGKVVEISSFSGLNGSPKIVSNTYSNGQGVLEYSEKLTTIPDKFYMGVKNLKTFTIPSIVTSIGKDAFSSSGLTEAPTLPSGLTSIGESAFYNCTDMAGTLVIPNTVTSLGQNCFEYTAITSLTLSSKLTSIPDNAFSGTKITGKVTIPASVTSIGQYAFMQSLLTELVLPSGIKEIKHSAFKNCDKLSALSLPTTLTTIGNNAFHGCYGIKGALTIPSKVTSIGEYTFYGCSGLTSLSLPNSLTSIGEYTFYECSSLTSLSLPNSLTSIGNYAFSRCSGIKGTLTIPANVTSIGNYAFSRCSGITNLSLPNSLSSIGAHVFE